MWVCNVLRTCVGCVERYVHMQEWCFKWAHGLGRVLPGGVWVGAGCGWVQWDRSMQGGCVGGFGKACCVGDLAGWGPFGQPSGSSGWV